MSKRRKFKIRENKINVRHSNRPAFEKSGRHALQDIEKSSFAGKKDLEVVRDWVRKHYKTIRNLQERKPSEWEGFSKDKEILSRQIYYDRTYMQKASKFKGYSMREMLDQFRRTELFISQDELYAQNMLKGMERHYPDDYKVLKNIIEQNPKSSTIYYDNANDVFVLETERRTVNITVLHNISPKEGIGDASNYIFEVV